MDSSAWKIHKPVLLDICLIYLNCEEKEKKELLVFSPDPQKQKGPKTDA